MEKMNIHQRAIDIFNRRVNPDISQGGGGGSSDAVQYIPQEITEAQQMQARKNQGLYYEMTDTCTWDGDTTGLDRVMDVYYRVPAFVNVDPNRVLQFTVYFNGKYITIDSPQIMDLSSSVGADDGTVVMVTTDIEMAGFIVFAKDVDIDVGEGLAHYTKGCYVACAKDTEYVSSITFGHVEKIPEKFLDIAPKDVPRKIPIYLDPECTIVADPSLFTVGDSRLYVHGYFHQDWAFDGLYCKMSDMPEFVRDIVYNRYEVFTNTPRRVMFQSENSRVILIGFTNNPDECGYLSIGYGFHDDDPEQVYVPTTELLPNVVID